MGAGDEQDCYAAAGATQARKRNCVIAVSLTGAACLLVYFLGEYLVRGGIVQGFIMAALEIPFYIIAFFIVLSAVFKKMEYTISPDALLVHFGRKGYAIPYGDIQKKEPLTHGQFFSDRPDAGNSRAGLFRALDPAGGTFLFGPYDSLSFGRVFLCATQAEEYLLLTFKADVPRMLISPERPEEFRQKLDARMAQQGQDIKDE